MYSLKNKLCNLTITPRDSKADVIRRIQALIEGTDYTAVEVNGDKPWGAYFRLDGERADDFVQEFFPGISSKEARLNIPNAELSPKILVVSPDQRLSWQYHDRRAERWAFLTDGAYNKSATDEPGETVMAKSGEVVQFGQSERHRLIGVSNTYTIVAEIWQHIDGNNPSDEDDITRLSDDYSR